MPTTSVSRPQRLALALAAVLFALTRLLDLDAWPLFIDEAQHLHWARRAWEWPPFLRPLTDGKALQVVLAALVVPFVEDPVRAGRLLTVAAGAVALAAAWGLAREIGGGVASIAAALVYAVVPFAVVHERLALADPFLAAASGVVLLLTVRLLRTGARGDAVGLGLALGAAVLAKVPGLLCFAIPTVALLAPSSLGRRRALASGLLTGTLVAAGPALYFLTSTAQLQEKLQGPESGVAPQGLLLENAGYAVDWLWVYLTPAPALLAAAGLILAVVRGPLVARLTALAAVLPVAVFLGAYHWFPRYILPAAVPLAVLAGLAAAELHSRLPRHRSLAMAVLAAATLVPALVRDAAVVRDPARVLPAVDRFQYILGWPAGVAGDAAWRAVAAASGEDSRLVVVDAVGHSTVHYVLRTRFMNDRRTEVIVSDLEDARRHGLLGPPRGRRVFVVVSSRRRGTARPFPPEGVRATFLRNLNQGDGALAGRLYEIDAATP